VEKVRNCVKMKVLPEASDRTDGSDGAVWQADAGIQLCNWIGVELANLVRIDVRKHRPAQLQCLPRNSGRFASTICAEMASGMLRKCGLAIASLSDI
jgi:hypothetical protein